ncbi:MAG: hypothetical protein K8F25_04590, partial [Fimbriimonadaceae bacterium]|nr:hypothetical protein [Alphaproteobacteria bacterium]
MARVPNSLFAYHVSMLLAAFLLVIWSISSPVAAQSDADALAPIAEQSRKRIEQGRMQLQNSDYTGAVTTLSGVIRNEKVPAEWLAIAFFYRGIANRSRAEPEAAVADFVNALWLGTLPTPIVAQTHYHRALAYAAIRKFDEAMADFDEAQRLAPEEQRIREARESVRAYMNDETTGSIAGLPLSPEDAVRNALGNGA